MITVATTISTPTTHLLDNNNNLNDSSDIIFDTSCTAAVAPLVSSSSSGLFHLSSSYSASDRHTISRNSTSRCRRYTSNRRNFVSTPSSAGTTSTGNEDYDDDEYHVEVSNLYGGCCGYGGRNSNNNNNYTRISISGQGVPGLLASICTSIAMQGGSIKELHAADVRQEGGISNYSSNNQDDKVERIKDIIWVVDRSTNKAFDDNKLQELGEAVMLSTKSPMEVIQAVYAETNRRHAVKTTNNSENRPPTKGTVTVLPACKFPAL